MCWRGWGGPSRACLKGPQHSESPGMGWVGELVYSEYLYSLAIRLCCLFKEAAGKSKRENSGVD